MNAEELMTANVCTCSPEHSPDECDETIVVRRNNDELPVDLARRSIRRIVLIEQAGCSIRRAIVVVAPELDAQWVAARHLLARALVTHAHVALTDCAELFFAVDGDANTDLRHEIMALIDALIGEPETSLVPIRVRFGVDYEPSRPPVRELGPRLRSECEHEGDRFGAEGVAFKNTRRAASSDWRSP
jgi:hypothetical protein